MSAQAPMMPTGLAWAPVVPAHWTVKKLAFLASLKSGDSITSDDIRDIGPYPVYGGNGLRGYTDHFTHSGEYALIGRQGALCGNINYATGEFWPSEHAIVVSPREMVVVRWLGELLRAMDLNQYSVSAAQPGLSVDTIATLKVPVPPLREQGAIADYLDRETKRLDALVAAKERVLRLLAEKRRALITRAVTRGLDPDAPLCDSGIPWLGEIPAHWGIKQAKFIFTQSALPIREDDEMVTCFRDGQVTLRRNRRLEGFTQADLEQGYQGIREGQLVLHSMDAFAGAIGVSDSNGKCSPEYIICDPMNEQVDTHYYGHLLRTMALAGFIQASCPAVRERAPRIRFSDFGDMLLPLPPITEQKNVVAMIEQVAARLDALQTATTRTIGLLKERRGSLIAAAVTGQIKVGSAA